MKRSNIYSFYHRNVSKAEFKQAFSNWRAKRYSSDCFLETLAKQITWEAKRSHDFALSSRLIIYKLSKGLKYV